MLINSLLRIFKKSREIFIRSFPTSAKSRAGASAGFGERGEELVRSELI